MKKRLYIILSGIFIANIITACNENNVGGSNSTSGTSTTSSNLSGQPAAAKNVTEQSWSYSYNSAGLIASVTGPRGDVTHYDYDEEGNLIKITDPLGHITQLNNYTATGNPQTIIDINGVTTTLTYTVDDLLASSTTAGETTSFEYDAIGELTKVTNPDGTFIGYVYDSARRLVEINGSGGTIKYTLDAAGNRKTTQIKDTGSSLVFTEQRVFDEINRLLKIVDSNGTQTFAYDNENNPTSIKDGKNNTTTYAWDALSRVTRETNAKNGNTLYSYDAGGYKGDKPTSVTDAKGSLTSYHYNGLENKLSQISPDSGTTQYTSYDAAGNLTSQIDANGHTINYSYDLLNRPIAISYSGDSKQNTNFYYDETSSSYSVGQLSRVVNGNSSIAYNYDAHGNMIHETQNIASHNYNISYAYNSGGKITSITYPNNQVIHFDYDGGEQIAQISDQQHSLATITHLPFGPINKINYTNGLSQTITYDNSYMVKKIQVNNLLNRDYLYYPNNDIKNISGIGEFNYDQVRQLTSLGTQQWTYDQVGNRLSDTKNGSTRTYTMAQTGNRLHSLADSTTGSTTYNYDVNGNIIQAGNLTYKYDSLNRLSEVANGAESIASYAYNPYSQRITKEANGKKTVYVYDEAGELLSEIDSETGITKRNYVWLDGTPFAIIENGATYFIHTDHNNAPQLVTNQSGNIVWQATYDAYGKATITTETIKQNLRFAGQYYDDETKLHYNWYRYYDPALGRYITNDPLGLAAGVNTYIYVNGNPINFIDPMGLETYQCTKPLHGLEDSLGKDTSVWAYDNVPHAYHQYSCIKRDGKYTCGGQDRGQGNAFISAYGIPSNDTFNSKQCALTQPDNDCFEKCLKGFWSQARPSYNLVNIFGGTNCQKYDKDVNSYCDQKCNAH